MAFTKITDLPIEDDFTGLTPDTLVAVRLNSCDPMFRTSAGKIAERLNGQKPRSTDYFSGFKPLDRHNLCDIVWYLKGMKDAGHSPFTDQIETLEKVVRALGSQFRDNEQD